MNIALHATSIRWPMLNSLWRWLTPTRNAPTPTCTASRPLPQATITPHPSRAATATHARNRSAAQRRPLRVVRIMEAGQPRSHVGRMVISGRMADVCAELDRLAASESHPRH